MLVDELMFYGSLVRQEDERVRRAIHQKGARQGCWYLHTVNGVQMCAKGTFS